MTRTIKILTLLAAMIITAVTAWADVASIDGVKYIDENGEEQTANGVTVLDGTETELAAGWYVCNSENLSYTGTVTLTGEVYLILADGKTMNVGTSENGINGPGIMYSNYDHGQSLTIYGQSGGTGALNVYVSGENKDAISAQDVTINGGHVTAIGTYGISATDNVTINGGQVTATGTYGIYASRGDITLGWKNATDFIKADNYNVYNSKVVKTADGKRFVALNMADANDISASAIVSGTVGNVATLADKTLKPLEGYVVTTPAEVTAKSSPDFTISNTPCYIFSKDATVTLSYGGTGFVQVTGATLNAVANQPTKRTFTMPAEDVALTATAVTGLTATAVTYNGSARTPVIKQGDDVLAAENYAIAYKVGNTAVTADDVKNVNTYTCTLTGVGQYFGTVGNIEFTIDPKSVTVTADDKTKASDEADPEFTATINGMVEGEDASELLSFSFVREDASSNAEGTYSITPQGEAAQGNYSVTYVPGILRIDAVLFAGNTTNAWMTWCDKNKYVTPENCSVYTVSGINGTTVTLAEEQNGMIPANTPVLIYRTTSDRITAQFNSHGADEALASSEGSGYTFYGNAGTADIAAADANFIKVNDDEITSYLLRNGVFVQVSQNTGLKMHRCLLNVSGSTGNAPVLTIELGSTGMEEVVKLGVESGVKKDDSWYSLDGRKLDGMPTKKGIYINGGRKVVIK